MVYMFLKRYVVGPVVNTVYRPKAIGLENVPSQGAAILASNHLSISDSVFMPVAVPRQVYFLAKSEYFTGPGVKGKVVGAFFRAINQIPMDRNGGKASAKALSAGGQALQDGKLLGIYPEGTRSPDGRLYRGKIGVARLALETGAPVVPIAMVGTDKIQPLGSKFPDPRKAKVTTIFGQPLDFSRFKGRHGDHALLREVTDQIMAAIQELSGQETAAVYAANYKKELAEHKREQFKTQVKDAAESAREKGRSMSATVSQQAEQLGSKLPGRSHDGHDDHSSDRNA
ncbi:MULTISPECIES: 1-acyl-sn-glycerol-3-phosphate acyltransferase [unclassified Candidatus Sulfotelmatobacter]|uniref:1-acyl-sn-glycerol-3-phosphate acyltransferase n=1 Tax=unclassified Candidatus Sulfotelmatobacter TaxID=2635724 RepID=UPI001686DEBB|nr:1-acyl-sn-glycerol-3-phosphate acyltransferase [Kocuria sp. cx-116]MBD2763394.1 1-acyl-sn-glycerol-3-phosphate acyltransferase [Kocuria sp. cx-116]